MNVVQQIVANLKRRKVVFQAYMINKRESEFEWKPQLENLCKNYCARLSTNKINLVYESVRITLMIKNILNSNNEVPPALAEKAENLGNLLDSRAHLISEVFNVRLLVNPNELIEKNVSSESLNKLREEATKILMDSNPLYISFE